jgi:hypothetical protein
MRHFLLLTEGRITFRTDFDTLRLLHKVKETRDHLGDSFDVSQGLIPYATGEGISRSGKPLTKQEVDARIYHALERRDDSFGRVLKGRELDRYSLSWRCNEWLEYGDWLARPRERRFFSDRRILVQEITRGARLRACPTDEEFFNDPGILNITSP